MLIDEVNSTNSLSFTRQAASPYSRGRFMRSLLRELQKILDDCSDELRNGDKVFKLLMLSCSAV